MKKSFSGLQVLVLGAVLLLMVCAPAASPRKKARHVAFRAW